METHLYGVFYTIIYVLLCRMFIETFEEKRNISKKIYRDGAWICLTVMDDLFYHAAAKVWSKKVF